jgi:hypothetical protein
MDVAHDSDWGGNVLHVGLGHQHVPQPLAQVTHQVLPQQLQPHHPRDALVQVDHRA